MRLVMLRRPPTAPRSAWTAASSARCSYAHRIHNASQPLTPGSPTIGHPPRLTTPSSTRGSRAQTYGASVMPRPTTSLLLLTGLLALSVGCHRGDASTSTKAPIPVLVRPVQDPSDNRGARYSGTIEPATRVDVSFKVGGYVRELL